jgi:D-threonate/D-erythronate kinase
LQENTEGDYMKRFLIIADDFTGAADTGVQLARRGCPVKVALCGIGSEAGGSVVIDTETRGIAGGEAAEVMLEKLKGIDFSQYDCVVKKVDSTLRGNIVEEIKVVDQQYMSELCVFMPAFPDMQRTTAGGVQLLRGVRITETELARDPRKPVTEDNLLNILIAVYQENIAHIGLDVIADGRAELMECRAAVFDAITNEDMGRVVRAALGTGRRILWVGTAALVDSLLETEAKPAPALALVASVSETTARQVRYAAQYGVELVSVDACALLASGGAESFASRAAEVLGEGRDVMLVSSATIDRTELDRAFLVGETLGMSGAQVSAAVQEKMGALAVQVLSGVKVSGIFLSGGDTAVGFLSQAGVRGAAVTGEVAFGIPFMKLVGGSFDGMKAITKAGAFGQEDAVLYALRKLKEQ